jgi:predicted GNAT family acetyltransferase
MEEEKREAFDVQHVPVPPRGAFVIERDGARLGEMTYVRAGAQRIIIDHTFVDDALRGTGAGKQLVEAAVAWARAEQLKVIPLCPFAKAMFQRDASLQDVLA